MFDVDYHQIQHGADLVEKIIAGAATWSELFQKHDFFHRYRNYIQVLALTRDPTRQIKWAGTVQSRMRHLIMKLDAVPNLRLAHPFVKGFDRVVRCASEEEASLVLRGQPPSFPDVEGHDSDPANADAAHKVYLTAFFVRLALKPKDSVDAAPRRLDVSVSITEFVKMVKGETRRDDGNRAEAYTKRGPPELLFRSWRARVQSNWQALKEVPWWEGWR